MQELIKYSSCGSLCLRFVTKNELGTRARRRATRSWPCVSNLARAPCFISPSVSCLSLLFSPRACFDFAIEALRPDRILEGKMSSPCAARSTLREPTPELFSSSPPPATMGNRKPKRPPPITPKRFTRFFTPRNSRNGSSRTTLSSSGRQLQDITRAALNRSQNAQRTTPRKTVNFADVENQMQTPHSSSRKRKNPYLSPETSPAQSSPSKRSRYVTPPFEILEDAPLFEEPPVFPAPVRRIRTLGSASRTLQRSFGGILSVGRGFRRDHCSSWQDQTADFYSSAEDYHQLPDNAPPFCTASCNSTWLDTLLIFLKLTFPSQFNARCRRRRRLYSSDRL